MPMGAGEARLHRRTAPLSTASIKRTRMEPPHRRTLRAAPRPMERRANMATAPRLVRPPTATSMRQQTVTPTRTPAAGGPTRMEVLILLRAMEVRIRVAHRPSAEAAEEAGDRSRRVPVGHQAWVAVVAGAAAGSPSDATTSGVIEISYTG
jgi:hypothetical protein